MSGSTMNRIATAFAALLLAAPLAACGSGTAAEPPLAGAAIGGPFTLTNQDGETVRDTDFDGSYRILYFGYTMCPDVCPVDVQNIAQGLKAFAADDAARAGKVVPIFVTVDPERDTVPVLKQFVSAFHPRLVGLTGSPEAIAETAREFAIFYQKQQTPGNPAYLVNHSRQAYLLGPDGAPMAFVPADESAEAVTAALDRWVR